MPLSDRERHILHEIERDLSIRSGVETMSRDANGTHRVAVVVRGLIAGLILIFASLIQADTAGTVHAILGHAIVIAASNLALAALLPHVAPTPR